MAQNTTQNYLRYVKSVIILVEKGLKELSSKMNGIRIDI